MSAPTLAQADADQRQAVDRERAAHTPHEDRPLTEPEQPGGVPRPGNRVPDGPADLDRPHPAGVRDGVGVPLRPQDPLTADAVEGDAT